MRRVLTIAVSLIVAFALISPASAHVQKESDDKGDTDSTQLDLKWVSVEDTAKKIIFKLATYNKVPIKKLGISDSRTMLLSLEFSVKEEDGRNYLGQIEYDQGKGKLIAIVSETVTGGMGWIKVLGVTSKDGKVFTLKIPRKLVDKAKAGNKLLWRDWTTHEDADPDHPCFSSLLPDAPEEAPYGIGCYDHSPSSGSFQHKLR